METLDWITIAVFSAAVLATGISLSRTGRDVKGFFAGGGDVPWGLSGLSLFMGFFSAGTFVVWGSIAYSQGLVAIIIQLTMSFAGFFVGSFIAGRWQRTGCLTAAEYIGRRFNERTKTIYTLLFLAISVFTTGSFLYPVGKIIEVATGIPLVWSIFALGVFCVIYVSAGGLRGVMVTDVLQFVILFTALVIVIPLSFGRIGGVEVFVREAPEQFFKPFTGEYTPWFIFAFCIYNTVFLGGNWSYVQRYTSVKDEKSAKKVGWLFGALYLVSPILWMLPPMLYRILNPGLVGLENENAYLLMCKEVLPSGFMGLMLGGMVFATASSLNGTLNICAGVFTNDIYKKISPHSSEESLIRVARAATVVFGVLAITVALCVRYMGGIVNVVISIAALTAAPIYLPVIWSLYSKRQNARTTLGVSFVSLAVNLIFKFVTPLFGLTLSRGAEMLIGTLIPLGLLALIEVILKCRGSMDSGYDISPGHAQRKVAASDKDNSFTLRVVGISISVSGLAVMLLGLLSNGARAVSITAAAAVMAIGLGILIKSVKQ